MKTTSRSGFTLLEMLVVTGIIAILIAILLPVLSMARTSAREARSISNLRQMMLGYTAYYQDNDGAVLFGYCPAAVNGVTIMVTDPVSKQSFGSPLADRYPWRLAPYVGNLWEILHGHADLPPLPQKGDSATVAFNKAYTLSLNPTYGINSIFVGGDLNYGGFTGGKPNVGTYIVFRATTVKRPAELIVFADSRTANVAGLTTEGLHFLTPPHSHGTNWTVVNGKATASNTFQIMGLPQGWYSTRVVTGFFDSHVEAMRPDQLPGYAALGERRNQRRL